MKGLTEDQIRKIIRDEREKIKHEEQEACEHLKAGTLKEGKVVCDHCDKELIWKPGMGTGGFESSPIDIRKIASETEVMPQSKSVPS